MKSFSFMFFLLSIFFILEFNLCLATINFGSRDSRINVLSGARLNVGSGSLSINGTLSQASGGTITGNSFSFDNGVLEQDTAESLLNGIFSPSAVQVLQFNGDGVLRGEPGSLIYGVLISGLNNVIAGQPTFILPVNLLDASSEVIIDLQNALSQNLYLNGGLAILKNDLSLGDGVKIVGPGTVDLNDRQLTLGGAYTEHWTGDIVFEQASSLVLTGSVSLDGSWFFNNDSNLNGNGAILDLSGGGKIILGSGASLYLEDVTIKGLGDLAGQIIFSSDTSKVYMSNVAMELSSDYTVTIGKIIVEGTSTFNHGPYQFNINTLANLTINGVTLWLEPLSIEGFPGSGNLNVSRAVYNSNGYDAENVAENIADGTLTYLNDGIIKRTVASSGGGNIDPALQILLSGDVHTDVTMNYFIFLPADGSMNFTGTAGVTLDGSGSTITFPESDIPQFVVQPGVTVNLVDITLANINNNTFDILPGGVVNIGDNVTFTFAQDVTISTPLFNILPGGHLTLVGADDRSIDLSLFDAVNPNSRILNIGNNTLTLANITLNGISHIAYGPNNLIELTGEANVNIDVSNGFNFKSQGFDNGFTFLADALALSGLIVFGDKSVNELHIRFALTNGLLADRVAAGERYPLFNISGGPGFIVGGPSNGTSRLIFDNPYVVLGLLDSNSMQLDTNAHLKYKELEIRFNPIKQYSSRILDDGNEMHGLKIDNSFIRSRLSKQNAMFYSDKNRRQQFFNKQSNQAMLKRDITLPDNLEVMNFEDDNKFVERDPLKNRKNLLRMERATMVDSELLTRGNAKFIETTIVEPAIYDQQYSGQFINSSLPFSGNIEMRNSQFDNFTVDPLLNVGLYMKQGSQIFQTTKNVSFVYGKHTVNVIGRDNKISIQQEMHINNNLFINSNSSVEFNFVPTGYGDPTLFFDPGSVIEISENSTMIFSGSGRVVLSDGVIIRLMSTENVITKEFENKASLIITNAAVLDFANGANSRIEGVGNIIVQRAAAIKPSTTGSLVIGSKTTDDISLNVFDNAQICLENPYIDGVARISMPNLATNLTFEKGGMLIVGANGVFELNVLDDVISRGVVTKLSFGNNGFLVLKDNGIFRFAENRLAFNSQTTYDFSWMGFLSNIVGGGYIDYKSSSDDKSFAGQVVGTSPELFTDISNMTFEQLAYLLVDRLPVELVDSTWYIKPDGLGVVITRDGVKVNLLAGDIITTEDDLGNIYGITKDLKKFKISASGVRS